jgi:hypothetical protein
VCICQEELRALACQSPVTPDASITFPATPRLGRASITRQASLPDGTRLHIDQEEIADLRRIFDLFDHHRSGSFTAEDLQVCGLWWWVGAGLIPDSPS